MLNIGVFVDGFRRPIDEGLQLAAEMKCGSFQVYITSGDMLAANMTADARKAFVERYQGLGLKLSATCGDFGISFADDARFQNKLEALKAAVLQTVDLGSSIMTTHIGSLPEDPKRREVMVKNIRTLGSYAADHGVTLATETGPESGPALRGLLDETDVAGMGVNFDPANLVMNGFDHLEAVRALAPYIVHTHAKDGVRVDGKMQELPLGQGNVNFPAYIAEIRGVGYNGAFTIERECGEDPVSDIRAAVEFLRQF